MKRSYKSGLGILPSYVVSGVKRNEVFKALADAEDRTIFLNCGKEEGVDVEYIEFPEVNHGNWNPAFNRPDFMSWLFQQKKIIQP